MSARMPPRYRLDEVDVDVCREQHNAVKATVPIASIHNWMGLEVGDSIGVAPKGPATLKLGPTVPAFLSRIHIKKETAATTERGRARLRRDSLDYLDVEVGDTLKLEKNGDEGPVLLRAQEDANE